MTKYNVVVISAEGVIIGVAGYDPINDGKRDERVSAAIDALASELDIAKPAQLPGSRGVVADDGNEWGRMTGEFEVGMTEIGFGKWGFEQ